MQVGYIFVWLGYGKHAGGLHKTYGGVREEYRRVTGSIHVGYGKWEARGKLQYQMMHQLIFLYRQLYSTTYNL
jgi:hypothetical protein